MLRFSSLLCLAVISTSVAASPQITSQPSAASVTQAVTPPPIAYVYVSTTANHIVGYAASATGNLTAIPGSPFKGTGGSSMAVNGKYLFGQSNTNIYSYRITTNGALTQVAALNAIKYNPEGAYGFLDYLFLDHTGTTLYTLIGDDVNNPYQAFKINQSNGELTFIWAGGERRGNNTPLTFTGKQPPRLYRNRLLPEPGHSGSPAE